MNVLPCYTTLMRMVSRSFFLVLVGLLVVLAVRQWRDDTGSRVELTFGVPYRAANTLLYVAQAESFFEQAGVEVSLAHFETEEAAWVALNRGELAGIVVSHSSFARQAAAGQPGIIHSLVAHQRKTAHPTPRAFWLLVTRDQEHLASPLATAFFRALDQAATFTERNPEQARELVAETLNWQESETLTRWGAYRFALGLPVELMMALERAEKAATGRQRSEVTFLDRLQPAALAAVAPELIQAVPLTTP